MHIPLPIYIYIHIIHAYRQTYMPSIMFIAQGKDAAQQPAERRGILGGERQRVGSQPGFRPEGALAMPGGKHV